MELHSSLPSNSLVQMTAVRDVLESALHLPEGNGWDIRSLASDPRSLPTIHAEFNSFPLTES